MKHLFLDFDGVVSPYAPYQQKVVDCTSVGGFDISYLADAVSWVNDKVADPEWEVYWLTTWTKKIHHLSVIGVSDQIHVIKPIKYINPKHGIRWKPDAGIAKYNKIQYDSPGDLVIWVDDDPRINTHPHLEYLHTFVPQENTGITQRIMDEIDDL